MKLRYRIAAGALVLLGVALAALAAVVSYDAPCESSPASESGPDRMLAIVYRCYGSPDVLELAYVDKPEPAPGQLLVKVRAASVNPYDWHYMRGSPYIMRLGSGIGKPADTRLGVDFSGTVVAIGSGVTRFEPGDEVFGGRSGAFAEYVTVRESGAVAKKPPNVTFEQAAGVSIAAITALQALRDKGQLESGQKVLINGASGGVGTFAVQIAKTFGAEVTGVCSTRNAELVRSIGADHVIDYRKADYTRSGEKFDLIIDNVGNHSLLANRRVLTPEGRFVMVGAQKGNWLRPLMGPVKALFLSPFVKQKFVMILAQLRQDDLAQLADLMRDGKLTPVVDRVYALHEVPDAIRYSESGRARGKIIIKLIGDDPG